MPSCRPILHDLTKQGLRIDKSYSTINAQGHIKSILTIDLMNTTKFDFQKSTQKVVEPNISIIEDVILEQEKEMIKVDTEEIEEIIETSNEVETKMKQPHKKERKFKKIK